MASVLQAAAGGSLMVVAVAAAAQLSTSTALNFPAATVITVVASGSKAVAPTPTAKPEPAPSSKPSLAPLTVSKPAVSPTNVQGAQLPPLDLSDMKLWNWNGKWHASEWNNANGPIPWRFNRIAQPAKGDTVFTLDAAGAPQLQAQAGIAANASGLWESEVTLPKLRDGMIVAPLWIYDPVSRDEVDFEFAGRDGLDVTLHASANGVVSQSNTRLFKGTNMSGQRVRFGIKVDQAAGYVEMYVNDKLAHRWDRAKMKFFVSKPMKPWIEMAPLNPANIGFVQWAGRWTGLAAGERLTMVVHGYRYSPLVKL